MDAERTWNRDLLADRRRLLRELEQAAVIGGCVLVALVGLFVALRRVSGALTGPASPVVLLACAFLLAAAALGFRRLLALRPPREPTLVILWAMPTVVLLLWAIGLSAGASAVGMVLLAGVLAAEEAWSWRQWSRGTGLVAREAESAIAREELPALGAEAWDALEEAESEYDDEVSQRMSRRRESEGGETISGWLAAEIAAGARLATAHIAICPPLAAACECVAEPMDGPPAQVKVAQVLPHGVRFEIKLDEPAAEPARVVIEFSIRGD
jgi:hypothetical protein